MARKYFLKVPNGMLQEHDDNTMKWICLMFALDETRNLSDDCNVSTAYLVKKCGLSANKRINYELIETRLDSLIKNGTISIIDNSFPPQGKKNLITVRINPDKFDCIENFTRLYGYEYYAIMNSSYDTRRKWHLLFLYLYLKSHCYCDQDNNIKYGYFRSLSSTRKSIGMSSTLVIELLKELTALNLLHKTRVGSIKTNKGKKNVPCIYIPCLEYTQEDITTIKDNTVDKMKEKYKVSTFDSFIEGFDEV